MATTANDLIALTVRIADSASDVVDDLLQDAMEVAQTPLSHIVRKKAAGKRSAAPKSAAAKRNARTGASSAKRQRSSHGADSHIFGKISKCIIPAKSYIRIEDEFGCMKCRWHLSTTTPRHGDITRELFFALKVADTKITLAGVSALQDRVKAGLPAELAIDIIKRMVGESSETAVASPGESSDDDGSSSVAELEEPLDSSDSC